MEGQPGASPAGRNAAIAAVAAATATASHCGLLQRLHKFLLQWGLVANGSGIEGHCRQCDGDDRDMACGFEPI